MRDQDGVEYCHCGLPLHYTDPANERYVRLLIESGGEHIPVTVRGRTWLVQRHYIALHGIQAATIHTLGFEELISVDRD